MSSTKASLLMLTLGAVVACRQNAAVHAPNDVPVASAGIVDPASGEIKQSLTVPYDGQPVTLTLDGSKSYDTDGTIDDYRWLSGVKVDADAGMPAPGVHRKVPDGVEGGQAWPDDAKDPSVALPQGDWTFVLWVQDNMGDWSDPSTVKVSVGEDPIAACAAKVLPSVSTACKTCACGQGPTCPDLLAASVCDQGCWNLIYCVGANCDPSDLSCIVNMCGAFLGAANAPAMAAGMCTAPVPCKAMCTGS